MARLNQNTSKDHIYTTEGGIAKKINYEQQLRRSVMACMLWEGSFYESGVSIADRISDLCTKVNNDKISEIAIEARNKMKLRHVPLLLCVELAKKGYDKLQNTIAEVIQRPDELTELLAIYWKDGKKPIANQIKKGLAKAFTKFNEYSLAKYNRDTDIKLRDVLFLCHAKPKYKEQEDLWKRLINKELFIPDTWEVALSSGQDNKEVWVRLIKENKLGGLAILRNLRNMQQVGLEREFIRQAIDQIKTEKILPYRFIAASKFAPDYEQNLEVKMFECLKEHEKLIGRTILLVDVSGSMNDPMSSKSDLRRIDAACGLAMLLRELCDDVTILTFSDTLVKIPNRRGFALSEAIVGSQAHRSTYLGTALNTMLVNEKDYDRVIVITDEQSHDKIPQMPSKKNYLINVACNKNGVGYYDWLHIDGFSESIVDYIIESEKIN